MPVFVEESPAKRIPSLFREAGGARALYGPRRTATTKTAATFAPTVRTWTSTWSAERSRSGGSSMERPARLARAPSGSIWCPWSTATCGACGRTTSVGARRIRCRSAAALVPLFLRSPGGGGRPRQGGSRALSVWWAESGRWSPRRVTVHLRPQRTRGVARVATAAARSAIEEQRTIGGASCETRDRPSFSLPESAGRGTVSGRDAAFAGWQ